MLICCFTAVATAAAAVNCALPLYMFVVPLECTMFSHNRFLFAVQNISFAFRTPLRFAAGGAAAANIRIEMMKLYTNVHM